MRRHLDLLLEGELVDSATALRVREHLSGCEACREHVAAHDALTRDILECGALPGLWEASVGGEREAAGGEREAAAGEREAAGGEREAAGGEREPCGGAPATIDVGLLADRVLAAIRPMRADGTEPPDERGLLPLSGAPSRASEGRPRLSVLRGGIRDAGGQPAPVRAPVPGAGRFRGVALGGLAAALAIGCGLLTIQIIRSGGAELGPEVGMGEGAAAGGARPRAREPATGTGAAKAAAEAADALRWALEERGARRTGDALRLLGYRPAEGRDAEESFAEWVVDAVLDGGGSPQALRSWRHRFFLVPEVVRSPSVAGRSLAETGRSPADPGRSPDEGDRSPADGQAPVEIEPVAWFGLSSRADAPRVTVNRALGHYRIYLVPRSRLLQHEVPVVPLPDREPALDLPGAADSSRWTVLVGYP